MYQQLPLLKACTKCGELKPATLDYFPRRGDYPDSLASWCKVCTREYQRQWSKANPDKESAKHKRYRRAHAETVRTYHQEYGRTHKALKAKLQRRFHRLNPNKGKEYYAKNPERYRRKQRVTNNRRRAAEGSFTDQQAQWQYERQQGRCFWCSEPVTYADAHLDHIIPVTRYGTNWIANIVCSCSRCNLQKGTKLPFVEWTPPKCLGR